MKTDRIILADDYYVEGGVGTKRPNDNILAVGSSGVGKSYSLAYANLLHMRHSSIIAGFSKPYEAYQMAASFKSRGYNVQICNLDNLEAGDVTFDFMKYLRTNDDITAICKQIVLSVMEQTNDSYWQYKAISLLETLVAGAKTARKFPSCRHVWDMFDALDVEERYDPDSVNLRAFFAELIKQDPHCLAAREYQAYRMLPDKTAACVRDTLAGALNTVFPESIRKSIKILPSIDFIKLATEKTALFIITSPSKTSLYHFCNLIYDTAIKTLLDYAQTYPKGKLPRPVKLFFDDFACAAPLQAFPQQISIFRSAGISTVILLQSESQLFSLYGEAKATTIINNCSFYIYFPGGMDRQTCKSISERMYLPLDDVMYAPIGKVFIMQSGKKPTIRNRYDIMHDPYYLHMISEHKEQIEKN